MVTSKIRKAEHEYYMQCFSNFRLDLKKYWTTIKHLMGTCSKTSSVQDPNDSYRCENFNNFFSQIGNNLESCLPPSCETLSFTYSNPATLFLRPITISELDKLIFNLKIVKSDIDKLPVSIFKRIRHHILDPLARIINSSFEQGVFPEALKLARITPVHKKGDVNDPNNFRPISSLHYISKIIEKAVSNRLISFSNKHSLINKNQFGFQRGKSTCDALLNLTETIYESLDNKHHNYTLMFDIKKAFDSVNHSILLRKLSSYGIRGVALEWFRSYLRDRKCYVEISSTKSTVRTFNIGVPQGSTLGPIAFLFYINDLPSKIESNIVSPTIFADDTTMNTSHSNIDCLIFETNLALEKLYKWTVLNRLTIHESKTEVLLFSNRDVQSQTPSHNLVLNNTILQRASSETTSQCKFLGVYLDMNLVPTFKRHINSVTAKVSKHSGILYRIRDRLPADARIRYYYAFIYPYLKYNVEVWGSSYPSHLKPLIIQHKRVIRTITNSGFNEHTTPLFFQLGLLKFTDIHKFHVLVRMHKLVAADNFPVTHSLNLRNRNQAVPEFHRLTLTQQAFSYTGPKTWNELPENIRQISNHPKFRKALKFHLLGQYNPTEI